MTCRMIYFLVEFLSMDLYSLAPFWNASVFEAPEVEWPLGSKDSRWASRSLVAKLQALQPDTTGSKNAVNAEKATRPYPLPGRDSSEHGSVI